MRSRTTINKLTLIIIMSTILLVLFHFPPLLVFLWPAFLWCFLILGSNWRNMLVCNNSAMGVSSASPDTWHRNGVDGVSPWSSSLTSSSSLLLLSSPLVSTSSVDLSSSSSVSPLYSSEEYSSSSSAENALLSSPARVTLGLATGTFRLARGLLRCSTARKVWNSNKWNVKKKRGWKARSRNLG